MVFMNQFSPVANVLLGLSLLHASRSWAQSIVPAADGTGTIVIPEGRQIQIQGGTQAGANLFHSFERFNLTADQTANFLANPTIQNILGRVTGGNASVIQGLIQVSGGSPNLVLMNPAGILFGASAQLNVPASFTATTANAIEVGNQAWFNAVGTHDYAQLLGNPSGFAFTTRYPGAIFNAGSLTVQPGKHLSLFGGTVMNVGTLSAPDGSVAIATVKGEQLIRITPQGSLLSLDLPSSAMATPMPKTLPELLTGGDLNHASQVTVEHGVVKLGRTRVPTEPGTTIVSGKISAENTQIAGDRVALLDAQIQAGQQVLIGGDRQGQGSFPRSQFLFGNENTQIQATGENATVILWSDQATRFHGAIDTLNTGFIETSGKQTLDVSGAKIDAGNGTWLLDPSDINIVSGGTGTIGAGIFDPPTAIATIDPATIVSALDSGTNVTITTTSGTGGNGDITLTDSIHQTGGGTASLTLSGRRFIRENNAVINMNSTGELSFDLNRVNAEPLPPVDSIQDAIDAIGTVNGNRVIHTGRGTYRGTIFLNKNVNLFGTSIEDTILSGENLNRVIVVDPGVTTTLRNLSITNGQSPVGESGGGILNLGNLTVRNTRIFRNTAALDGGGISSFGAGASLVIADNSRIENNRAQYGGGISSTVGVITTINQSSIVNNTAIEGGGGIENTDGSQLSIQNSSINNNTARYGGGITLFQSGAVTIDNSSVSNNDATSYGGGIDNYKNTGDVTITRTSISNNTAGKVGGGIFNLGTLTINAGTFDSNSAGLAGGGIRNEANLTVNDSIFNNSKAEFGGGVSNEATGNAIVNNNLFSNNIARVNGGAIVNDGVMTVNQSRFLNNRTNFGQGGAIAVEGDLTVSQSHFSGNVSANVGGAIATQMSSSTSSPSLRLAIIDSTFTENSAYSGGAMSSAGGNTSVNRSTIANNTATMSGGGITVLGGNLIVINSTISTNNTSEGGGFYITNGTIDILSSTITNNSANGGGIYNDSGTVSLGNSILAGNRGVNPDVLGLFNDLGNNLIGISDGSSSFTISTLVGSATNPIDPGLGTLADNGGFTQTHALLSGSPAINAGNNVTAASRTDQRGFPRIQQGTIDIGAFESDLLPTTSPSTPLPSPTTSPTSPRTPPISPRTPPTSPTTVNPGDTTSQTNPNPLIRPNTEGQQPLTRVIDLDRSLSNDFTNFFGLRNVPNLTIADVQDTLANAQRQREIRSAIIYAIFVPKVITPAPVGGEPLTDQIEPITPLLRSRLKQEDDRLELILVTGTGRAIRYSTNTTRAQVTQQAKLYRLAVSDVEDDQSYQALSKQLFHWLVQPLEADLQKEKITSLIYCFDEGLRTLPIAAMSDNRGFAIDRYTMSIIPSVALINRDITGLVDRTMLAMGADQFKSLEPLPAVPTELKLVSEQFWRGTRFLNQDFTVERLLQEKKRLNPGIVHLATHAKFNAGAPDQSYIQFWDRQVKLSEMTSIEWSNPPLQLLVLSACDTAIGSNEAELGFSGLAAAAGVHSVLGSLWDVSDVGTLALMSEFYIQLQQSPTRSEALRRAQAALRNGTVRIENGDLITSKTRIPLPKNLLRNSPNLDFRHPFYWSAFTLVGNPW